MPGMSDDNASVKWMGGEQCQSLQSTISTVSLFHMATIVTIDEMLKSNQFFSPLVMDVIFGWLATNGALILCVAYLELTGWLYR
jgi:uncharacterized membrane protein